MRYIGLFIVRSYTFQYSLDNAKCAFYRAVNVIFGKIGRTASEDVVLELIKSKCLPILLYGLEACLLTKANLIQNIFQIQLKYKIQNTCQVFEIRISNTCISNTLQL